MKVHLPKKTRNLVKRYIHLRIGPHIIACPYYQNIIGKKRKTVYAGKGLPEKIEKETLRLFRKNNKNLNKYSPESLRLYMTMADLGIDCSGFVMRIIESLLRERGLGELSKNIKPKNYNPLNVARHFLRTETNLSADTLTNSKNCNTISNLNEILPGDLIRVGKSHLAIITEVEKSKNKVKKIIYHHSTSDYLDQHGVRKGVITINKPNMPLEKQKWEEYYQGKNWMLEDYSEAKKKDRGIRRMKMLSKTA
ncbi:MAG: hypothetical protein P8Y06_00410 [Patescibacteria group bacterium]